MTRLSRALSLGVICVYEDEGWSALSVLCDLRPVFDLRCGRLTLLEKLRRRYLRTAFALQVRAELAEVVAEAHPDCVVNPPLARGGLFLNGRAILDAAVPLSGPEAVLVAGEEVVGFRLKPGREVERERLVVSLPVEPVKARVIRFPWELVELNAVELAAELAAGRGGGRAGSGVGVVGPRRLLAVKSGARVWPGTVISTETGPVLVDRNAQVRPGSFVEGPCYIGPGTAVDGAKVRPGCSFGPHCRIGGEVEASVFQGYSNKHHDGFIGHSFVGEWVNLGAGTTNSDLKNAYEPVRVELAGRVCDTGRLKVGCFIGDHVKTAIGTLLNTGTVVGAFANWFEPGLSPKAVARFARGAGARLALAEALATARAVMARRGVAATAAWERLVRSLYRRKSRA